MINQRAVDIITKGLTNGVIHPGDSSKNQPAKMLMPLPGFRNAGLPPGQAAAFANEAGLPDSDAAKIYAEALVATLEAEGTLGDADQGEIDQLRAQVATPQEASPTAPEITVHCACNGQKALLVVPVGNRAKVTIDGGMLKRHMGEVCTC
jgi:hypothetical protein